jgi:transglutaminase-like putative cysteine protease
VSARTAPAPRWLRVVETLPVVGGLVVNIVAHDRALFLAPVVVVLLGLVVAGVRPTHTSGKLLVAGGVGLLLGVLTLVAGAPPPGPFPPVLVSPLCGLLVGLACFCALSRETMYAWVYSWVLVALSGNAEPSVPLYGALGLVMVVTLAAVFARSGLPATGWRGFAGFGVTAVVAAPLAAGLVWFVQYNEGLLVGAVYQVLRNMGNLGGLGFEAEITLRSSFDIQPSQRLIMELGRARPDRLRTTVMDRFDGQTWRTSADLKRLRRGDPPPDPPGAMVVELLAVEDMGAVVPVPGGTTSLEGASGVPDQGWVMSGQLRVGRPALARVDPHQALPPEPPPGPELTAVPENLAAALKPITLEVLGDIRDPRQAALHLVEYFQANFEYALKTDLRGKDHPLVVMLKEKRPAYCVYFASAMALMLRVVGVPSRVVGGLVPEERNAITGRTAIRERDAHAWVEAYLPEEGRYVPFDPTPWRGREELLGLSRTPGWFDAILQAIRSLATRAYLAIRHAPLETLASLFSSPWLWGGVGLYLLSRWRRRRRVAKAARPRDALPPAHPGLARLHARFLRLVKRRAGITPQPHETDDDVLVRLRPALGPPGEEAARAFLEAYRLARYRGDTDHITAAEARLAGLEALLAARRGPA